MKTTLTLLLLLTLSACATPPLPGCVDTVPASELHGCDTAPLAAPLPEGARVSDFVAGDIAVIEALAECRASYRSLINHLKIACPQ